MDELANRERENITFDHNELRRHRQFFGFFKKKQSHQEEEEECWTLTLTREDTPQNIEKIANGTMVEHRKEKALLVDENSSECSSTSNVDQRENKLLKSILPEYDDEDVEDFDDGVELLLVNDVERPNAHHQVSEKLAYSRQNLRRQRFREKLTKEVDVDKYMASRAMTAFQERMNAITMIPGPLYCLYYILSGSWIDSSLIKEARENLHEFGPADEPYLGLGCFSSSSNVSHYWLPQSMPALPPLTVLAVAIGVCCHAPFSMLYHWKYATSLPPGAPRTTHWSRRMDHAMIHFYSACMSYATSGSWRFFIVSALFNIDCICRQFKQKVLPRSNKVRAIISVLLYLIPLMKNGDFMRFLQILSIGGISLLLFTTYPIGGWSHSAFHLVITLTPYVTMTAALDLPASQEQLRVAAECVGRMQDSQSSNPMIQF